jgi:predicted ATPase/transcriptional regulator with XRE-family HTH domain
LNKGFSFGYWVRRRRKALDLTQTELAGQVYCALSTIKKIEMDERRPSRQMAERIADCLHIHDKEREVFLKTASADLSFDQLHLPVDPVIFQLAVSNLASYQPLSPFVGYEDELVQITNLIKQPDPRLITLVGPGGIGKTRIAIQVASDQMNRFLDGVYFIPLAQLDDPAYIPTTILDALVLQAPAAQKPEAYLLDYLRDKAMLLVLDNFEHLLDGIGVILYILRSAPMISLLITSRQPLNLRMEQVFNVQGMKFPPDITTQDLQSYDAVRLFIQTASRASSGFSLNDENIDSIVNICKLVEGMPLAIELAASWTRTRSCREIENEIKNCLDILASTMQDVPERQRSIRAAFDFSWRLLSEEEKRVFSALSIFRGGFTLPAAEEIIDTNEKTLEFLVIQSLLRRDPSDRYDMHILLRLYAEEKLIDAGDTNRLRDAHLSFYLRHAENSGSMSATAIEAHRHKFVEKELDNFRAALNWAVESGAQEHGLRLATAIGSFWNENGYLHEGNCWLNSMLNLNTGHFPSARAYALINSGHIARNLGNFEQAVLLSKQSLTIFKELKDRRGIGLSLMNLGIVSYLNSEFDRGARLLTKSLSMFQETEDDRHQAEALIRLGDLRMRQGKFDIAARLFQTGLLLSIKLDNKLAIAFSLGGLGDILRSQGKYKQAVDFFKKSLNIHWEYKHNLDIAFVLEALALDYKGLDLQEDATLLWGAAESLRERYTSPLPPSYRESYNSAIMEVSARLGETDFKRIWAEGRATPLEHIMARVNSLSV